MTEAKGYGVESWRERLARRYRACAWILLPFQMGGTLAGLVFLPSNVAKAVVLPLWWLVTFGPMKRIEIVEFCLACLIFSGMNAMALHRGIFAFTYPDVFGMPWFELFMWGFYLVHTRRALARFSTPRSNRRGVAVGLTVCFAIVFSAATGDVSRFFGPLAVILVSLAFFHEVSDFLHIGYMVFLGALIEYSGIATGQWSYPSSQLAGVPLWFITMWAGVGLYAHRIFSETLAKPGVYSCGTGILPVFHGRDAHATRGLKKHLQIIMSQTGEAME